jgi:DNA-binding response OmpR family regulator
VNTVLLIDDDAEFGRALAEALDDVGIDVLYAPNAARGIELALVKSPDVVLADQHLPDRLGTHTLRDLRALGFAGAVVLISGSPDIVELAASHDFDGHLGKPIDLQALLDLIESITRRERP